MYADVITHQFTGPNAGLTNLLGPLFTKRTDVLPQDLVKHRSREIRV